jgi:nitrate reductase (cytochrome), electron transfer subunit
VSGVTDLGSRLLLIGVGSAVMAAAVVGLNSVLAGRASAPEQRRESVVVALPGEPIAAEANVFRRAPDELALPPDGARRDGAHPRTLASYRSLRDYPGAPPRIPHGLTTGEYAESRCNVCHEQGGFSARFAAYVPVTPHPELTSCLQCHLPDDAVVGTPLPGHDPDAVCRQCHVPGSGRTLPAVQRWPAPDWPELAHGEEGVPPEVPHTHGTRSDCVACHAGPGAVAEIRTRHPERANCRQCHMTGGEP